MCDLIYEQITLNWYNPEFVCNNYASLFLFDRRGLGESSYVITDRKQKHFY